MKNIVIKGRQAEIVEKKSRFICNIKRVDSEQEAIEYINEIKKQYWDARHNCYAFIIGNNNEVMRFSDDGEPSSTAGKPILDVLIGNEITNAIIVVTRYFGGVLLGTGGLVRAYQSAAVAGIKNSVIARKSSGISSTIKTDYNGFGKIQYIAANMSIDITSIEYTQEVVMHFICEDSKKDLFVKEVTEATSATAKFGEIKEVEFYRNENKIVIE